MKILVKALEDTDMSHGDVTLEAKAGETLTLSPREAEIALSTGKFEFVKEFTESKTEKTLVENQNSEIDARRADLKKAHSQKELYEMAKDLPGIKKSMNKDRLIDELLKPRAAVIEPPTISTEPPNEPFTESSDEETGEKQPGDE